MAPPMDPPHPDAAPPAGSPVGAPSGSAPDQPLALQALKLMGPAVTDAWYLVDEQDRILDYNASFFALLPRPVARRLRTLCCKETFKLQSCQGEGCLRSRCNREGPLQLQDIDAEVGEERLRFIVSALPMPLGPQHGGAGALIILRNVTSEARVQDHYRAYVRNAELERHELEGRLDERTRELLAANDELNRLEAELARLKRGGA